MEKKVEKKEIVKETVTPEQIALKVLQNEVNSAAEGLEKFKKNLEVNPSYAFQWGDSAIECAAVQTIYPRLIKALEKAIPLSIILREVREDVEFKACCEEHSTGQCSNLVARAELKVLANFIDKLKWVGIK